MCVQFILISDWQLSSYVCLTLNAEWKVSHDRLVFIIILLAHYVNRRDIVVQYVILGPAVVSMVPMNYVHPPSHSWV